MKKWMLVLAVVATVGAAFIGVSTAAAQAEPPQSPTDVGPKGMGPRGANGAGLGLVHEALIEVVADKLGLDAQAVEARLAGGETLAAIASSEGMDLESLRTLMEQVRSQVLDEAVAKGLITAEQSSWMQQRAAQNGWAAGECPMWSEGTPQGGIGRRFGAGFGPAARR
jgi:hypothetical protein